MSVAFRRFTAHWSPLTTTLFAWEQLDDGQIAYASETISIPFLKQVVRDYGVATLRTFWRNLRTELAARVEAREYVAASPTMRLDLGFPRARTFEQMQALLGLAEMP